MQSKQNLTKQTTPEANGVVSLAQKLLPDLDANEIIMVINEYQSDKHLTVCPECSAEVSSDDLTYAIDRHATREEPEDGHNQCPECFVKLSQSDLEKPTFELWLKLTA
ncbi:hypothetical protein M8998_07385 [Sphingobacterium sp. lm-10]|uniref:hypothetical protein n=1 Tax=Sphingobacterium sp. lm-10 TaxID=2944904 RepID=UPI0020224964|nr:hypothetical protein [Sphingobacterium sp. lm-10]MCL7987757.1 hypothetical protein [Sphingobacterium sp. lm-10]